jgi:hypothetical protein
MAEGRRKENWSHTSHLLAMLANANRDAKKQRQPFSPNDFNPFAAPPKPIPADITALKLLLPPDKR